MNSTAMLLLKWLTQMKATKDQEAIKKEARYFWDRYGETVIKRSLNNLSCISIPKFIELCNFYKNEK